MAIVQNYATVFFIPFIPTYKTVEVFCKNCHQKTPLKKMPESFRLHYRNLKQQTKIPFWMFSGTIIFFTLLFFAYLVGQERNKRKFQRMSNIHANDIYGIKINDTVFTLCRFDKITTDTLFYQMSNIQVNKEEELINLKAKGESQFGENKKEIAKVYLLKSIEDGTLLELK